MQNIITIKGMPHSMLRRILPNEISDGGFACKNIKVIVQKMPDSIVKQVLEKEIIDNELVCKNIKSVAFVPMENGGTFIDFEDNEELNYLSGTDIEGLFRHISGH